MVINLNGGKHEKQVHQNDEEQGTSYRSGHYLVTPQKLSAMPGGLKKMRGNG